MKFYYIPPDPDRFFDFEENKKATIVIKIKCTDTPEQVAMKTKLAIKIANKIKEKNKKGAAGLSKCPFQTTHSFLIH